MPKKASCLEELKKKYRAIQSKYKLPDFAYLNENFEVEKLAEEETDFLLRGVRKIILEKIVSYLQFNELLLNPSNGPMFFFAFVSSFSLDDKKTAESLYEKLVDFEIEAMDLNNEYSEEKEAAFIKRACKEWQDVKEDISSVLKSIKASYRFTGQMIYIHLTRRLVAILWHLVKS